MHMLDLALPHKIPQSWKWRGLLFGTHSPLFQLLGDFLPGVGVGGQLMLMLIYPKCIHRPGR